ncbi:Retinal cone rhodopsin-sensitive cGMP 3',5'-cyclic phosphodiesterase subunit gamma, partial [Anas platyrhynchos]
MSENPTTNLNTGDAPTGPTTPRKGPPKFKQRQTRQFKSKPPKKGVKGYHSDLPMGSFQPSGTARAGPVWDHLKPQHLYWCHLVTPQNPPWSSSLLTLIFGPYIHLFMDRVI